MSNWIKKWKHYLLGRPFELITDHKALQWLQNTKDLEGRLARWALALQPFQFTIKYRPGSQHGNADAMTKPTVAQKFPTSELIKENDEQVTSAVTATVTTTDQQSPSLFQQQPSQNVEDQPSKEIVDRLRKA